METEVYTLVKHSEPSPGPVCVPNPFIQYQAPGLNKSKNNNKNAESLFTI
jgi:hypothetical protein